MNYIQHKRELEKQQRLLKAFLPLCKSITEELFITHEIKNINLRIKEVNEMSVEDARQKIEFETLLIESKL